jgi:hypothetical protein
MNGRVYDYRMGRFLSVDPIISNPANSQSINPYSYIGNNPLSGVDPTGYEAIQGCTSSTEGACLSGGFMQMAKFNAAEVTQVAAHDAGTTEKASTTARMSKSGAEPQTAQESNPNVSTAGGPSDTAQKQEAKAAGLPERLRMMGEAVGNTLATPGEGWNVSEAFKTALKIVGGLFTAEQVLGSPQADPGNETTPQEAPAPQRSLGPNDPPQRYIGPWTQGDLERAKEGKGPLDLVPAQDAKGQRMPLQLHHGDQVPGSGVHEVAPGKLEHATPGMHPNPRSQGVTDEMRKDDARLHWWMRGQEMGNPPHGGQ